MTKYKLLLSFFLVLPLFAMAQDGPEVFRKGKLDNGLTYYIRHTEVQPGRADFYLVQNVGALMEEDNQNGLAHFLEHMAFNGSENFPEGIPHFLKRRGVTRFNAHTAQDETVYYMNFVPARDLGLVDSCLLVLRDWSGFLLLDPREIDKERGVIFEERRTRRNAESRLREQTDPVVYNHSKYATHNIIGTVEVLSRFTPGELRAYYTDFYRPDLQAVVVIGDIDVGRTENRVKTLFGVIPKRENPKPRQVYGIPDNAEPMYVKATDREVTEPSMLLIKRTKAAPAASLKEMMKDNLLRLFYNRIVSKSIQDYVDNGEPAFAVTSVSFGDLVRHYSSLSILVQAYKGQDSEALRDVLRELERIHRFGLNDRALKEQVDKYMVGLDGTEQHKTRLSNEVYAEIYQNNFLEGKPITSIDEDIALSREILAELTAADLQQWVAAWYDTPENWVFVMQGNDEAYPFPAREEIMKIMQEVKAEKLEPHDYTIHAVPLMDFEVKGGEVVKTRRISMLGGEEWTLSNGCKVYYKYTNTDGMKISLLGQSPGGMSLVAAEDLPSAMALEDLKTASGIYKHDSRMMEEIMKGRQVSTGVELGETYEGVSGVCDSTDVEVMFQLIYLFFEKPRFERKDFERYVYYNKMQARETPRTVNDTVNEAITRLRLVESPRLWKEDEKFYEAMSYDKMVEIYKDRFSDASDFRFYLTGNISREAAQRLVARYLGAIPSLYRKEKPVKYDFRRKGSMTETIEANIPDDKYIVSIEFNNRLKLKPKEELCMDILGMALSDCYRSVIREDEGGSYGVNVAASANHDPVFRQSVAVNFETSVEKGDRMRAIVHEQIRRLTDEGIDEDMVEDAVLRMKKGRANVLKNRGNAHWMEALRYYAAHGGNIDDPALFEKVIDKIRAEDVQALARKFFATAECVDIVVKSK